MCSVCVCVREDSRLCVYWSVCVGHHQLMDESSSSSPATSSFLLLHIQLFSFFCFLSLLPSSLFPAFPPSLALTPNRQIGWLNMFQPTLSLACVFIFMAHICKRYMNASVFLLLTRKRKKNQCLNESAASSRLV